jgi:hypothetical protein
LPPGQYEPAPARYGVLTRPDRVTKQEGLTKTSPNRTFTIQLGQEGDGTLEADGMMTGRNVEVSEHGYSSRPKKRPKIQTEEDPLEDNRSSSSSKEFLSKMTDMQEDLMEAKLRLIRKKEALLDLKTRVLKKRDSLADMEADLLGKQQSLIKMKASNEILTNAILEKQVFNGHSE